MPPFRDRPLTWLFIVATILVDVTEALSFESVLSWSIIGQLSAVAIWTVMSKAHRLARAGVFLAVVSLIAGPAASTASWIFPKNFFLTLLAVYAVCVVLATCPIALFRCWMRSRKGSAKGKKPWQFPLIELFGWTIVVAYASFACRFLNSETIWRVETFEYVLPLVFNAVLAAMILEGTTPAGYWSRVVVFAAASLIWMLCIPLIPFIAFHPAVIGELRAHSTIGSCYLIAWSTVRMLDERRLDMPKQTDSETVTAVRRDRQ